MHVTVRLFARLRELAGASELEQELPADANAGTAWSALVGRYPALAEYGPAISCAVNEEYARWFPSGPPTRYVAKLGVELPGLLVSIRMTAFID